LEPWIGRRANCLGLMACYGRLIGRLSAAILLCEMGFTNVSYVEGGMKALLAEGLPTE
jgi:hypothetical protein